MKWSVIKTICIYIIVGNSYCNKTSTNAQKPYHFSARTFLKSPSDRGFRRNIYNIDKNQSQSFWRFLELYVDAEQRNHQVRIMKDYYVNYSEEKYRLPALMFMYNAFDPLDPAERKRMILFLKEHLHERHVLGLFLYRYGTYNKKPPLSFANLYKILIDRIPNYSFPDMESLHFMDLMISQEINSQNFIEYRQLLNQIWRNEISKQTPLYASQRDWFRKVNGYTRLGQMYPGITPVKHSDFISKRREFFRSFGFSGIQVINNLELTFKLNDAAFRLPDFLPRMKINPTSRIKDHRINESSPFIITSDS